MAVISPFAPEPITGGFGPEISRQLHGQARPTILRSCCAAGRAFAGRNLPSSNSAPPTVEPGSRTGLDRRPNSPPMADRSWSSCSCWRPTACSACSPNRRGCAITSRYLRRLSPVECDAERLPEHRRHRADGSHPRLGFQRADLRSHPRQELRGRDRTAISAIDSRVPSSRVSDHPGIPHHHLHRRGCCCFYIGTRTVRGFAVNASASGIINTVFTAFTLTRLGIVCDLGKVEASGPACRSEMRAFRDPTGFSIDSVILLPF